VLAFRTVTYCTENEETPGATPRTASAADGAGRKASLNRQEAQQYRNALVASRYNVAEAARQLGLTRAQLAYRLKRLGLD